MKLLLVFSFLSHFAQAALLYSTDFENFTVGDNQWAGTDGWVITDDADGISFIDNTGFGGALGNYAVLGLERPGSRRPSVLKQLSHDHVSSGESLIEVEVLITIKDSENSRYDDFYVSFFNSNVKRMATIRFDNEDSADDETQFGIWREQGNIDGNTALEFDTFTDFIHEEPEELFISIDLANNRWSASISGLPLFTDEVFTTAENPSDINLGIVGFEWQVSSVTPLLHGDNFMLVDNYYVSSFKPNESIAPTPMINFVDGEVALGWEGTSGSSYQVEYSDDLENWHDDLPNSTFSNVTESGPLTYIDTSAPLSRYYRIVLL